MAMTAMKGRILMFDNARYLTRGVEAEIPLALQLVLWQMIDGLPVQKDYLQVFRLESMTAQGRALQKITHTQEQPPYKKEYLLTFGQPLTAKLFAIDDGDHSTLLLSDEY